LLVAAPVGLAALDAQARGRPDLRNLALLPARNPIILASAAGLLVALAGWRLPDPVLRPFELVGSAAVPAALLALGMSLRGSRPLAAGPLRADRFLAVGLKTLAQPVLAYLIARFALGLEGAPLFAAVVLSALPTAQNVFVYALRYERGESLARDAIVLSTVVAAATLMVIAILLGS
jgi:predicted permease